jgi:hypothetical protein
LPFDKRHAAEPAAENVAVERLGWQGHKRRVGRLNEDSIEAQRQKKLGASGRRGERHGRRVRPHDTRWVGIEREGKGWHASGIGNCPQPSCDRGMTEMDPIKVADRDGRSGQ